MRKELAIIIIVILAAQMAAIGTTFATHSATIQWVKPQKDDPSYIPPPGTPYEYYWNGITPKWISFTVKNNGPDPIKEIKIIFQKYTDGNSMFNFSQTRQSKTGWYATPDEFGLNKRPTVLYFRTDSSSQYIAAGETVTFGLLMTEGPEECSHNIDVWTVDAGPTPSTNFYELWIVIDKHLPAVQITSPPNGTIVNAQNSQTVEVDAKATDLEGPHLSGIKNATLHIDYIIQPEPEIDPPQPPPFEVLMKYDSSRGIYYVVLGEGSGLIDEAWHNCTVYVFDYAENGPVYSAPIMFFWFRPSTTVKAWTTDPCFLYKQPVGHVGGNAIAYLGSGFKPLSTVTATLGGTPIGQNVTDSWGRFELRFKVPEMPRNHTAAGVTVPYTLVVTDDSIPPITARRDFTIIPWMQIDSPNLKSGNVGDQTTVKATGFDSSAGVDIIYRDVSLGRVFYNEAMEWSDEATRFKWTPYLDNYTLGRVTTSSAGTATLTFTIPESYGGNHPIFGREVLAPNVRSGWMPNYPEAAFFKVTTKVWTDPTVGMPGQYVHIYATGLPLPEYHSETYDCKTGKTVTVDHEKYLALDFGPNKYWVFEKGFILNNEFDYAWSMKLYLPFAYWFNHEDPHAPTWNGTLYWKDAQGEFHNGSQFLKVPALAPGDYEIALYQFDRSIGADEKDFIAITIFTVIKDPLYVRVNSGSLYFKSERVTVYAEIDLDGTATNPTAATFAVYHEDQFLMSLTAEPASEGLYVASFTCPDEKGSYFIMVNATKELNGGMTLRGFGTASFVVSETLDGFNATLTGLKDGLATISTSVGTIKTDISTINGKLVGLEDSVATIKTDIGTLKATLDSLNTQVTAIGADNVIIKTSLGEVQGKITDVQDKTVDIQTNIGKMSTTTDSIQNQTGLQQTGIALSLIAALAAIIAAILVFRKLYK